MTTPEDAKIIETGVTAATSEALRPFTDLITKLFGPAAEEIGSGLAAGLTAWRTKRQVKFWQQTRDYITAAGFEPAPVPPKTLLTVIQSASVEDNDDLQNRWAALLANAANPATPDAILPAFPEILKQLSPIEAKLLDDAYSRVTLKSKLAVVSHDQAFSISPEELSELYHAILHDTPVAEVAAAWNRELQFHVLVSNLVRLGLIEYSEPSALVPERLRPSYPPITPEGMMFTHVGEAFVKACRPPETKPKPANG